MGAHSELCSKGVQIGDVVWIETSNKHERALGDDSPTDPSVVPSTKNCELAFLQCTWEHESEERCNLLSLDGAWSFGIKGDEVHHLSGKEEFEIDVSVLLITSGRPQCLKAALDSLSLQDFARSRLEIIVIDDSSDCSLGVGVLEGLDHKFVSECLRYVYLQQRSPLQSKLNLATFLSHGRVLIPWNEDAYYGPTRIRLQALPVLNGEVDSVFLTPTYTFYSSSVGDGVFYRGGYVRDNEVVVAFRRDLWSCVDYDRQFAQDGTLAHLSNDIRLFRNAKHSATVIRVKELDADAFDFIHVVRNENKSLAAIVQRTPPSFISPSGLWHLQHGLWHTGHLCRSTHAIPDRDTHIRCWSSRKNKKCKRVKKSDDDEFDSILHEFTPTAAAESGHTIIPQGQGVNDEILCDTANSESSSYPISKSQKRKQKRQQKERSCIDDHEITPEMEPEAEPIEDGNTANALRRTHAPQALVQFLRARTEIQQILQEERDAKTKSQLEARKEEEKRVAEARRLALEEEERKALERAAEREMRRQERQARRLEVCQQRKISNNGAFNKVSEIGESVVGNANGDMKASMETFELGDLTSVAKPKLPIRLRSKKLQAPESTQETQDAMEHIESKALPDKSSCEIPDPNALEYCASSLYENMVDQVVDSSKAQEIDARRDMAEVKAAERMEMMAAKQVANALALEEQVRSDAAKRNARLTASNAAETAASYLCRVSREDDDTIAEANVEGHGSVQTWRIRCLLRSLALAKSSGHNSMLSLIVSCKDNLVQIGKMLADSLNACDTLQLHAHKVQAQAIIVSAMQRLKLYKQTPKNGLAIFCGFVASQGGKERKVTIDFVPLRPINTSLYRNGKTFFTDELQEMFENEERFGFIIIDGNGTLFGILQGDRREIVNKFGVSLPRKHGRGGQSALRFARLRSEKRQIYLKKVSELATAVFIANDKPNIAGLVIGGSADLKTELSGNTVQSSLLDQRLAAVLLASLDLSYGGERGFFQAVHMASPVFKGVKLVQEKQLVTRFMQEVAQDTGKYCFGIQDTLKALGMGAVDILILWESLEVTRLVLRDLRSHREEIRYIAIDGNMDKSTWRSHVIDPNFEILDSTPFVEWIVEVYKEFGAKLEFVTSRSQEGHQFCNGFGGFGGILRYRVDFGFLGDDRSSSGGEDDTDSDTDF